MNPSAPPSHPHSDPGQLLALVRAQFDARACRVSHLSGERDLNFLLEREGVAQRCVLKISDTRENPAALALQNAAMEHLALHAPQLPVQRLHRWQDGSTMRALPGADGVCYARVLDFLPGQALHLAPPSAALRHDIGATLGRLDAALQGLHQPPVRNEALLWDMHRTAELQAWLPAIQDARSRAWAEEVFARYLGDVEPLLATLPAQFLHNDFNPHNLLVDARQPTQVCGVLDFGDMLHGPRVFDAAVAASYQAHASGQPRWESLLECMQGYQQANPLQAAELRWLPLLAALRCAITLCITEQRALWFPENRSYILRNHGVASAGLRAIMERGLEAASTQLLELLQPRH